MIGNYIKLAWRTVLRNKTYSSINIVGLTLSTTSCILLFTFIVFHYDFDTFHYDKENIYRIVTQQKSETINYTSGVPSPLGQLLRDAHDFEEDLARIVTFDELQVTAHKNNEPVTFMEHQGVAFAELSFFNIFNFPLMQGVFSKEFTEPNKAYVTENIALKYFGTKDAIGKTILVDNRLSVSIIGILKDLPLNTFQKSEIFLSFGSLKDYDDWFLKPDAWGGISTSLNCFIKLKAGVSPNQVEKVMAPFPEKFRHGNSNTHTYLLQPLNDIHFNANYGGNISKKTLWTLAIIGLFLILSACFNFINLATSQILLRLKEVGVRKSLGSNKSQIFWQFMTETALLSISGIFLGYMMGFILLPILNQLFGIFISNSIFFDYRIVSLTIILFVLTTIFSGTYPSIILANFKPVIAIKGKLSHVTLGGFNLRRSMIVAQFVISQVLVICMLIIIKQVNFSQQADLGFDKESIVLVPVPSSMRKSDQLVFKERLGAIPNVKSSTLCMAAPSSQNMWSTNFSFKGKSEQEAFPVSVKSGDADFTKTFGLQIITGRNLTIDDTLRELLVNETFIKKMNWASSEEAIGKIISINGVSNVEIVGVVKDFHDKSMHGDISPICIGYFSDNIYNIAIKVSPSHLTASLKSIQEIGTSMNPNGVFTFQFVDESIKQFYQNEQIFLILIKIFTLLAIFIGAMGLYGLITFMVERKTKEIGIRKTLGSSSNAILWLFGKEFSLLLLISFFIAAPLGFVLGKRWLQDFTYHIEISPDLYISAFLISTLIAILAISYKTLDASYANPVKSLRYE